MTTDTAMILTDVHIPEELREYDDVVEAMRLLAKARIEAVAARGSYHAARDAARDGRTDGDAVAPLRSKAEWLVMWHNKAADEVRHLVRESIASDVADALTDHGANEDWAYDHATDLNNEIGYVELARQFYPDRDAWAEAEVNKTKIY